MVGPIDAITLFSLSTFGHRRNSKPGETPRTWSPSSRSPAFTRLRCSRPRWLCHCGELAQRDLLDGLAGTLRRADDEDHVSAAPGAGLRSRRLSSRRRKPRATTTLTGKTLLVRMPWDAAPALGERLGVTVGAARRDLVAPGHRVPSRLSPLDCTVVGHPAVGA
jgi:hypothetical protein